MLRAERNGIAAEVKKMYAEQGGISAAVVKVYAEKNGIAELVFPVGELVSKLVRNTYISGELSVARHYIGGGATKDYAFFVGGFDDSGDGTKNVDAVDINGVVTAAEDYAYAQGRAVCVQNGDESDPVLLVFRGPDSSSSVSGNTYMWAYKNDLTRISGYSLSYSVVSPMAFSLAGMSYIGGGRSSSSYYAYTYCYSAYNVRTSLSVLSAERAYGDAAATDEFGVIVGGRNARTYFQNVDVFNTSNVMSTLTLSVGRTNPMVARLGDGILVAGGYISRSEKTDSIEHISKDKVVSTIGTLRVATAHGTCTGSKEIAAFFTGNPVLFADGGTGSEVEYINKNMVATLSDYTMYYHAPGKCVKLGNRVFVAGGQIGGVEISAVEAYDIKQEEKS